MKLSEHLQTTRQVFLDTAPVIYYIEENPYYLPRVDPVFEHIDTGIIRAVASPITLAECLVLPLRNDQA